MHLAIVTTTVGITKMSISSVSSFDASSCKETTDSDDLSSLRTPSQSSSCDDDDDTLSEKTSDNFSTRSSSENGGGVGSLFSANISSDEDGEWSCRGGDSLGIASVYRLLSFFF